MMQVGSVVYADIFSLLSTHFKMAHHKMVTNQTTTTLSLYGLDIRIHEGRHEIPSQYHPISCPPLRLHPETFRKNNQQCCFSAPFRKIESKQLIHCKLTEKPSHRVDEWDTEICPSMMPY